MLIYVAEELSNSLSASTRKYFKTKARGHELFFSKKDKLSKKFLMSEIVFGNIPAEMIKKSFNLQWVQLESTGFSEYMVLKNLKKKIYITNLKGFFATQVAQTALASILAIYRGIVETENLKNKKKWIGDPIRKSLSTLDKKNIVLIGNGSINKAFKRYIKPFDCKVESFNSNTNKKVLIEKLKKTDLVICALPGTNKTNNFFDKRMLSALNKKCIFVNVGRGNSVDENFLIRILVKNKIRGAALDVTKNEPLNKKSILWTLKNVILTQHTGGGSESEIIDKIDFFINNLKKFNVYKNKIINKVNLSKGY